jgi:hypothetical protein
LIAFSKYIIGKKSYSTILAIYLLSALNPFILSSITPWTQSDVNIFFVVTSLLLLFLSTYNILFFVILCFLYLLTRDVKVLWYVSNILAITIFSSNVNLVNIKLIGKITVIVWMLFFVVNAFLPEYFLTFFNRPEHLITAERGLSGFTLEPTNTALFLGGFLYTFENKINKIDKILIMIMTILTANIVGVMFLAWYAIKKTGFLNFVVLSVLYLILISNYFQDSRLWQQLYGFQYTGSLLFSDVSMTIRSAPIFCISEMITNGDYLGFDYSKRLYSEFNLPLVVSSGVFVWLPVIGVWAVFFFIYLIVKSKSIMQYSVLFLFIFTGSLGHFFPIALWLRK